MPFSPFYTVLASVANTAGRPFQKLLIGVEMLIAGFDYDQFNLVRDIQSHFSMNRDKVTFVSDTATSNIFDCTFWSINISNSSLRSIRKYW